MGDEADEAAGELVAHADRLRYRIAIVDPPPNQSISAVRAFRGKIDSTHAAFYHPWVEILDPLAPSTGGPAPTIALPPSGFVAGIYARSDVNRGVSKAPANEVVAGLSRFEQNINTARQQVLTTVIGSRANDGSVSRIVGHHARTSCTVMSFKVGRSLAARITSAPRPASQRIIGRAPSRKSLPALSMK